MTTSARNREASPLETAVGRIGDRWAMLIVEALLGGPQRFGDLGTAVRGIAPNVLSQRLKALERNGIVVARPYSRRPLRHVYELSAPGQELGGALRLLAHWGARSSDDTTAPRHDTCGTALETRWYCPTCAAVVADDEESDLRFL
ncbi:MAG TPA: helix-turn-helix domain-containing protein [Actinomycetota bacterium]|nr:helix-turn-helix domain-containing protein [Actinomycetota bacterium]